METLTFLCADIEGSTRLLAELGPDRCATLLGAHHGIVRAALGAHGGQEIGDPQRDGFFAAFASPAGAVSRGGRVLVAAATCEHLVEVYAEVADAILRHCPRVRRLATSREPLGISGETIYRVPSLSLPAEGRDSTSSDAVALFLDRARAQGTGLTLDEDSAALVAPVCRRLDGLPLARELAAVRLRSLSLEDLHHRLDRRFRLLAGGSRSALSSRQLRRATVETVSRPAASPG